MFIGHFALGFALKRAAPRTNLGWLIASVEFLDLVWPVLVLAGIERVEVDPGNTAFTPLNFVYYPFSHSLAAAIVWSIVFGAVYFAINKYRTGTIVVAIGVFSHWILDWISHGHDLALYPGSNVKLGLGLWNSFAATVVVESLMFVIGVWIYIKMTKARDRIGVYALWAFILFLALVDVTNIFSPPPPSSTAVASLALLLWLTPFWSGWADEHRGTLLT
jgi:membrane-bound metal-dependent hydrolase YbcI (DUF457 family)